jgi:hypothetical protein
VKSRIYILFSLFAHTLITFVGLHGMATMGIILYYNFFDASEVDTELFFMPSLATVAGYVGLGISAAIRRPKTRILIWAVATVFLIAGGLLLFTRSTANLNYKITLLSAIPYLILTFLSCWQMIREAKK